MSERMTTLWDDPLHQRDYYRDRMQSLDKDLRIALVAHGFFARARSRHWKRQGRCPGCGVTPASHTHGSFLHTPGLGCPLAP